MSEKSLKRISIIIISSIVAGLAMFAAFKDSEIPPALRVKVEMVNDMDTLFWCALTAYHEARGEGPEAQKAVCHVVLNRMDRSGKTAAEVIFKPYQFSWANDGERPPITEYHSFLSCFISADMAVKERVAGHNMSGATHFHDVSMVPGWAPKMHFVKQIGKLKFYRE
jgi:spore germination cell wall hydrolase CwlJ-like protein